MNKVGILVFKRLVVLLVSIIIMLNLSGCVLEEIAMLYSISMKQDGLYIEINEVANCCFVGGYECGLNTDNTDITIPDEYDGVPIKRIGGYHGSGVPTPFRISLLDVINAPESSEYCAVYGGNISEYEISEEYSVENVVFNLHIGKNIETIEYVVMDEYYPHINEDNSITFYHPVVNITCSEENKKFYSEEGKLYYKKSGELVEDFEYAE